MDENFIHFENVRKDYKAGEVTVTALHDVSFSIGRAEICVIVGESGAGKTTLLNILGGMDRAKYDEILGLDGTPYRSVVGVALGYRAKDDAYAREAKVRFPAGEVIDIRA